MHDVPPPPHQATAPGSADATGTGSALSEQPQASAEEFRAALARLAAGVVLVSAHDPEDGPRGEDVGMTATAFLSVSLEPPLVLVSVRSESRMGDLLDRVDRWAVSVLAESQRHIAGRFALKGRVSDRLLFEDTGCTRGPESGAPLIDGALATVECRTEQRVVAGDHTLFIGRVLAAKVPGAEGAPLVYFQSRYRGLA